MVLEVAKWAGWETGQIGYISTGWGDKIICLISYIHKQLACQIWLRTKCIISIISKVLKNDLGSLMH